MPDIESEIRLKSSGADQVARDLSKIKEAAEDTSESLEGVQGDYASGGGQSPFSRAISQNARQSSQTAKEVSERQERNSREMDRAKERETEARGRSGLGLSEANKRAQGAVSGVAEGVQQVSQGGPSGLVGGIGGAMSKLLAGPAGWAMLATGLMAKVGGDQAEQAFQFHRQGYTTGISQRLGINQGQRRGTYQEMVKSGIAPEMVDQYMQSMSQSGGRLGEGETVSEGIDFAMDLGADAGSIGKLAGMSTAMGFDRRNVVANREMMRRVMPAFGEQNVNTFLGGMTTFLEGQQQAFTGQTTTEEMVQDQAAFMANLRDQGLTASAASQLANQTAGRDRQSSQLGDPTDVMALQAMREGDESILDTMARMEEDPTATREAFLERISGMDETAQVIAVRRRYNTNVSGARRIISGEEPGTGEEEGTDYENLEEGEISVNKQARKFEGTFSRQLFAGMQDTLANFIADLGDMVGLYTGEEAGAVTLTDEGAMGGKELKSREEQRRIMENTLNQEGKTGEALVEASNAEINVERLENFGISLPDSRPTTFGFNSARTTAGILGPGLGHGGNAVREAAVELGADSDKVNTILTEANSELRRQFNEDRSQFGEGEGEEYYLHTIKTIQDYLERVINTIIEQTEVTREGILEALGMNQVQSEGVDESVGRGRVQQ